MRKRLAASGYMSDVDSDYNPNMPETEIIPDRAASASLGVPVTYIANGIATLVGGLKMLPNKYTDAAGHRDDIQVKLVPEENKNALEIDKLMVRNVYGEVIPMSKIVNVKQGSTLLTITRFNRERGIGTLTIKKRGIDVSPEQLRSRLALRGDDEATLVLTRVADEGVALLVQPF